MSTNTLAWAYGFMFIILFSGMFSKGRKVKYRLRMIGYWYMIFLNIALIIFEEDVWFKLYYGVLTIFWIYLADKDFRSTQYFDREYARLDALKQESKATIDRLFYDRRN
jgi:hypothetical protein